MATAFIFLMAALAAIGVIITMEGNAKRRSAYYEEKYKEVIPFDKRNFLPRGYQSRVLAMPNHTQGVYDDTYATTYNYDRRRKHKQQAPGHQRLSATLLFTLLMIILLAFAAMRKKEHAASGPLNKAELYLKY